MKLQFLLTEKDYIEFNIYHMNHSPTYKKAIFFQRYILSLVYLILPFFFAQTSTIPLGFWLIPFIIVWLLWVLFYKRYAQKRSLRYIRNMIKEGRVGNSFGKITIELNDKGIVETTDNGESTTKWNGIDKLGESKDYFFLYMDSLKAYIVPKRCFVNDEEKDAFINEVKSKLSN